jgi:hypothetical protein
MPQTKAGDKSVTAVLSGTDYVELVPPPPDRFSYKISNVFGMNTEPYSTIMERERSSGPLLPRHQGYNSTSLRLAVTPTRSTSYYPRWIKN